MPFTEGHSKIAGREKGKPDKLSTELRNILKGIIESELEALPGLLNKLSEKDRAFLLIKLLPFVLPKVEPINCKEGEGLFDNWE